MISSEATKDNLSIYHQNIQSLHNNKEELSTMLLEKHLSPHFICLSEHHMKEYEIHNFSMPGYNLTANYCQSKYLKVEVCIFA
jgi:NAD-dependent SIR2 family protein deacetylase